MEKTMVDYLKPLPDLSDENRPFWEACRASRLEMQKCLDCGHIRYPIQSVCPECLSERVQWTRLSGRGEVLSRLVFHQVYHKAYAPDVPYNVVLVQLDEGPRMFSNVVGVANESVKVGMRVRVVFERATEQITIPRFQPE